ncbi:MAG: ornithine cyclodeaminase family protein [Alphaproteobacteria bacterium]
MEPGTKPIHFTYLSHQDMEALALSEDEVLQVVEESLAFQGRGETVIEPRVHLYPDSKDPSGRYNVLRGVIKPWDITGIKVVATYRQNYEVDLPCEIATLQLFNRQTGEPVAFMDATEMTFIRTGAVTAIGAKYLARKNSKILGHIGARGVSYWDVRLLDHMYDFDEIRVHSERKESREAFAERLRQDLGKDIIVTDNWQDCVEGADIVVEASRLRKPEPLLNSDWIKKGAFVCPFGSQSACDIRLLDKMDKVVVDDWGQCRKGGGNELGALRAHVNADILTEKTLYAEMGEIAGGVKPGRQSDDETTLFWHRGIPTSDIAMGYKYLEKARAQKVGQTLRFF